MNKLKNNLRNKIIKLLNESIQRIPFYMDLPNDILELNNIFNKNGYSFYIVGGAVRDAIEKKEPKDFDISTDATPQDISRILDKKVYKFIEAGNIFPVVHLKTPDDNRYEIATFRNDLGSDHRKPETEISTLENDVLRRDLTINALYYDINSKEIIDMVGGVDDIKNKIVRTVGAAQDRFDENRIRVLRAIRFAARTGSELDNEIKKALTNDSGLHRESQEAIGAEFLKGIKQSMSVVYYLNLLFEYGVINWIFPEVLGHSNKSNKNYIVEEKNASVLFACLLQDVDYKNVVKYLVEQLRYPKPIALQVEFLLSLKYFSPNDIILFKEKQNKYRVEKNEIIRFSNYVNLPKECDYIADFQVKTTFNDIQHLNLKGAEIGNKIKEIEVSRFLDFIKQN